MKIFISIVYSIAVMFGIKLLVMAFIKYPVWSWHLLLLVFGVFVFRSVYKYLKG